MKHDMAASIGAVCGAIAVGGAWANEDGYSSGWVLVVIAFISYVALHAVLIIQANRRAAHQGGDET